MGRWNFGLILLGWALTGLADTNSPPLLLRAGEEVVGRVWLAVNPTGLVARYEIQDTSPLQNAGRDWKLLFKTGDSVDLQLDLGGERNVRVLMTETATDGPVVVLYRYGVPDAPAPERFWSPTGEVTVDVVEKGTGIKPAIQRTGTNYTLTACMPWASVGITNPPATLRGDVGVLFSDPSGAVTVERLYHFNKNTSVVADIPSEVRLTPDNWGVLKSTGTSRVGRGYSGVGGTTTGIKE